MTWIAGGAEVVNVYERSTIGLADILKMFLYTEVIGMMAVFSTAKGSFFIYPIFIAIAAIARLIILQGEDMAPGNILFEPGAILLAGLPAFLLPKNHQT